MQEIIGNIMSLEKKVLAVNNDLPIKTKKPVHSGKVRSVYWLTDEDSQRLIKERGYDIADDSQLAVMVISDRISAFDCNWKAEGGLNGVPGKGAALNAISSYWFKLFREYDLANSHILEEPHPLVWIVQKARPIKIEAIARQYITGSMWRAYAKGERTFCGINLPESLEKNQKLAELLITPSTKGILHDIPNVPAVDDCSISRRVIEDSYAAFDFHSIDDIDLYEKLLREGFELISKVLASAGHILVDTKFEFGYVKDKQGNEKLIYMDEVGTPDSSRFWNIAGYQAGKIVEQSKEGFRQQLLNYFPDSDILLNSSRMNERLALAHKTTLPAQMLFDVSRVYTNIAQDITGITIAETENPRQELIDILDKDYGLIEAML